MAEVIVITSGKGGVGKTTATANIGSALAEDGKKVLLIDTDIGLRNLDVVLGLENRVVFDLVDLVQGDCRPSQAMIKDKNNSSLFLIPAAQSRDKTAVSPKQMKTLCESLAPDFDYILIDCPAGIEQGFRNAIAGANKAIIVTAPEVTSVRDADRIIGLLCADEITDMALIVNKIRPELVKSGDMLTVEDTSDILSIDLLGVVPDDEKIVIATNKGEPVIKQNGSPAGQAYRNISKRIQGEKVEFLNLFKDNKLMEKFKKIFTKN